MQKQRTALSPDNLNLISAVARTGSMAAAARELGLVPSALTYRVRQIEDALDVLLFDRSARRAQLTPAGAELLRSGQYLLDELDAVAQRVKRVATGWEPQLTIAADAIISHATQFELCEAFYATGAPTRLKLRAETLSGTTEALQSGQADLALGVFADISLPEIQTAPLGSLRFVYAVAPHHPLAAVEHPLCDDDLRHHRAVAVADTAQRLAPMTVNLLPGQDVLTVPSMRAKLEALLRGLGCGYVPEPLARPHLEAGHLVRKTTARGDHLAPMFYAWRAERGPAGLGRALQWWLQQLESPKTRRALLERHAGRAF